jgi:formate dehydrogenase major subunit
MASETPIELPWGEADQALAALDKVLAEKPEKVGYDFSRAMHHLAVFRDGVIARVRHAGEMGSDADRPRLRRLNGVMNAVYAGHFPLGPVPWETVQTARDAFAALVQEFRAP